MSGTRVYLTTEDLNWLDVIVGQARDTVDDPDDGDRLDQLHEKVLRAKERARR